MVALGDPASLRDASPNAWVRAFFNRQATAGPEGPAGPTSEVQNGS